MLSAEGEQVKGDDPSLPQNSSYKHVHRSYIWISAMDFASIAQQLTQ